MLLMPVLLLAAVMCGCNSTLTQPPGMGSIELGTTALDGTGFQPLTGDQTLVPGAQGGFHIWLKYRVDGMAAGPVTVKRTVRRVSDDKLVLTTMGDQTIGPLADDGSWELPMALPSFMCPSPLGVNIIGEPMVFDVLIVGPDGKTLGEGTAEATPHCPTDGQAQFCQNICSG
jgi:hypothetical protein